MAKRFKDGLRDGTHQMFYDLNKQEVPCLVFSAGLGDSVVSVLQQANVLYPNVKVISNFLQYSSDGTLNGLQDKMIHTFNKNETALEGTEYYDLVHDRDHVIVMGDSLGDAGMADGIPTSSHVLKIGFLFDHVSTDGIGAWDLCMIDVLYFPTARAEPATIHGDLRHRTYRRPDHGCAAGNFRNDKEQISPVNRVFCDFVLGISNLQ